MITDPIVANGDTTYKVVSGRYVIMASGTFGDGPRTIAVSMNGIAIKAAGGAFMQANDLPTGTLTFTVAGTGTAPAIVVQVDKIG